jgi:hypothetical protein
MRRVLLLFVVLLPTFSFLPGCGGDTPSPEMQKQRQQETEAAMKKGEEAVKEAMKNVKK